MNTNIQGGLGALFLMASAALSADESSAIPEDWRQSPPIMSGQSSAAQQQVPEVKQIRDLLEMQRQGTQRSSHKKYISGAEKTRVYQRYLDSFTHSIPEQFADTGFSAE